MNNSRLYVGDLASGVTQEELLNLFAQAGEVQSVEIIARPPQQTYAFVEMASAEGAQTAVSNYNGYTLSGLRLIVYAVHPRSHPRSSASAAE